MRRARFLIACAVLFASSQISGEQKRIVYSDIRGIVQAINPRRQEVTLRHEKIPGYMDSMTMPFHVHGPHLLDSLNVNEAVIFELVVLPQNAYIDAIVPDQKTPPTPDAAPKPPDNAKYIHIPQPGEAIPDIVLTNQDGKLVRLQNYKGKVLALNFIYTQCPLPTYCPLSMANFATLRRKLGAEAGKDVVLFTVSFDPRHDTPERLKAYGNNYKVDQTTWQLLTGKPEQVEKAVSFFDINYWTTKTGNIQEHTLSTVLVNQAGYVSKFYTGPDVKVDQLVTDIQDIVKKGS